MSAVDGLITGMDTSTVIRQLMQLERIPVTRLQSKKTTVDKAITALQSLNTKFQALAELARAFKAGGWTAPGATSSDPARLGVTVAEGTAAVSLTLAVKSLAATHVVASQAYSAVDAGRVTNAGSDVQIRYLDADGAQHTMTVTNHDGSLQSIADALNGMATSPVSAEVISDAAGTRLEVTSKKAGDLGRFDVFVPQRTTNPGSGTAQPAFSVTTAGTDAEVLVGTPPFQTSVKGTTNVLTVAPGVSVNLLQADPTTPVAVTVTESSKPGDQVQKLVDAANDIIKDIKNLTAFDPVTKKGGALQGNTALRGLQTNLLRAVYDAVGGDVAGSVGLETTRDGTLKFDRAKFDAAFAADPVRVADLFARSDGLQGVAQRIVTVAEGATKFGVGTISVAIDQRRAEIKRIDDAIAGWDVRLARREARFRRQFAALETMLGAAQQQGNWLAGQINSLPRWPSD